MSTEKKLTEHWSLPVTLLVVMAGSLYWVRYIFDPLAGQGWVNLMTVIVGGSLTILLVAWFCIFSSFHKKTVITTMAIFLIAAVGWAASIQQFEFDGDMNLYVSYRWGFLPPNLQNLPVDNEAPVEVAEFIIQQTDSPEYRGVRRDGIVIGPKLRTDWEKTPLKELWRTPVGAGYASMAIVDRSLITIEQRGQNEAITCYDTQTGKLRWVHEYQAYFYESMGGLGPRTTPTVSQGFVVSMGAMGDVTCLDFQTGKEIWSRNLLKELSIPNVVWGMSSSPLVFEETVCLNPGGPKGNGLIGLNLKDGGTVWECSGLKQFDEEDLSENLCGYSSPMFLEIDGVKQIVIFDGHGLSGHAPSTGRQLWHFRYKNGAGVNVAQPILLQNRNDIFLSSSYSMGSALITVEKNSREEWDVIKRWHDVKLMRNKFSNPVYYQGYVYGLDEGILMCIDPKEKKKQWKKGRYGHGQVLLTGDQLLILAENGDLAIVTATPEKYQEQARQKVLPRASKVWNPHALVDGIVYVRDHHEMAAFDLR